MAVALNTLVEEADRYLASSRIADYRPNGLQVEGVPQVMRIVSGVTASQALLDAAVEAGADLVLVHHGYFWKGENPCITGMKQRRLKTLLKHDISLLAYHLPLDLHPEVGNNVQLARQLDITVEGPLDPDNPKIVGLVGSLSEPMTARDFARKVQEALGREPLLIEGEQMIRRVGWCTGGGRGISIRRCWQVSTFTSAARPRSRPSTAPGRTASASLPPGIMPLSATASRRWVTTWRDALPWNTSSSIARIRSDCL